MFSKAGVTQNVFHLEQATFASFLCNIILHVALPEAPIDNTWKVLHLFQRYPRESNFSVVPMIYQVVLLVRFRSLS